MILIPQELIKIPQEPPWAGSHNLQPHSCHVGMFARMAGNLIVVGIMQKLNPHKNLILIPQELIKIPQEPSWAGSHDLQPRSCHVGLFGSTVTGLIYLKNLVFGNTYFNFISTELNSTFTVQHNLARIL